MTWSLPIRVRLTLWYSIVLALCLAAFSTVVWLGLRQNLMEARQTELQERMGSFRIVLQQFEYQSTPAAENLKEEIEEFAKALPADFSVEVLDSSNAALFQHQSSRTGRVLAGSELIQVGTRQLKVKMSVLMESVDETLWRLGRIVFLSIPLALIAASLGGYWLSKRALSPVRDMAMAARSINSADLSMRLPVPAANDELRLLARMWNEMLDRLQNGVERIQRFTSDASHDLRTPLATIRVSAEIALRKSRDSESYQDTLQRILKQTDRATTLVEDLLTLARTDGADADLTLAPLDLSSSLRETCESLRPLVQGKNLELLDSLPSTPVWVNGDARALARVISILIDNALKNTAVGSIQVQLDAMEREVLVTVQDTGSGIASSDVPHIFDRFYRGDKSRSSENGGSGLGLAIAKRLVELHQGTITVESEEGKGARLLVRLPHVVPQPANL